MKAVSGAICRQVEDHTHRVLSQGSQGQEGWVMPDIRIGKCFTGSQPKRGVLTTRDMYTNDLPGNPYHSADQTEATCVQRCTDYIGSGKPRICGRL